MSVTHQAAVHLGTDSAERICVLPGISPRKIETVVSSDSEADY